MQGFPYYITPGDRIPFTEDMRTGKREIPFRDIHRYTKLTLAEDDTLFGEPFAYTYGPGETFRLKSRIPNEFGNMDFVDTKGKTLRFRAFQLDGPRKSVHFYVDDAARNAAKQIRALQQAFSKAEQGKTLGSNNLGAGVHSGLLALPANVHTHIGNYLGVPTNRRNTTQRTANRNAGRTNYNVKMEELRRRNLNGSKRRNTRRHMRM
jgi:hypothetical protein